jgi:CubicO group peptidase (beta-lactamase class C family)
LPASESAVDAFRRLAAAAQAEGRLPSLSAAVFRGHEVVWQEAIGLADVEAGRAATPDTQYRVASITKTFTAAAVMQLRDAGALDLDDPLTKHIPEAAHAPTIRRLLSHLSGLQREPVGDVWESFEFPSREELVSGLAEAEQVLPPGQQWHYSNLAFGLLGEVVERASGQPYTDFVDERLLRPLGLARTTWTPVEPAARGYLVEPYSDAVRREPQVELHAKRPAGSLASTTGDLARWGAFLADPDPAVLAPATVDEMHLPQALADVELWTQAWALGPALIRRGDTIFAGHTGGFPGFLSIFLYSRTAKIGAVALANASVWPKLIEVGLDLATKAIELLPAVVEEWRPDESPPAEIEPLLGRWWSEGAEVVFSYRRGRLEARQASAPPEREPSVFEREAPDRFRTVAGRERGEVLRVVRGNDGAVDKLYWATYPFTRTPEVLGPKEPGGAGP